ncbi:Cardiolipin synthase (CMP-forming)-like [Homarus americanus]|uniref:cardiolipin synthase (CMP-forming) n=1 Tax=Homarus americanus TaxID=6706 RepID=A0A8J5KDI5_HOMAM|nr:Cardiolipin synthase (CMP-forming)-like [Homarus americanus]
MAAHMISSALTTLLINEPFTHHLLRHNLHRTIQQRRKTRGIIYTSFELYSSSWPLKTDHRKTLRENIWTVPNLLCVSRIAFSPVLVHLVVSSNYSWALGLFMLAGFTDLLDGWIARTFPGQASNLGSFLDPLADKVLVALLFLSLTYVGLIPLPLTGLIIYRDVLIIGGASYVRYKSLPPPVNTAIQLSLITASLAAPVFCFTDHYLLKAIWWVTAATTLSSGISYIFSRDTYKILSNMNKSPQK